ncbi:MAG TPA: CBS domain-containing protein [Methanoregulaceae archaeon]|jgi:CBS domain-containing protein|nr:CBS domain-containing protein [Methanolinea sp.]MCC7567692.1 CBS domain-containing protein [Methanoregulaceae archaeon]MDD3091576.1 CBS domain-containing protein [Methanoregulaceae archaeon]MDD5047345.1 CBS domain-containing protein [Methanoregulaceae archaeon]MDD5684185.1 CBS domain-containing protein [Methanoregulaceae archaeon]
MHHNERNHKQGDKLLKMPGKLDRGPVEFKSRRVEQEGEIMAIATRDVVSVPPSATIQGAVETMTNCGFRRLPVVDPGSRKIRGILTSGDIINFMGGGDKFNLVQVKHGGNLLAAINESVRTIMTQKITSLHDSASIADAIAIITGKMIGGIPIIDDHDVLMGMVTERDVMKILANERVEGTVEDVMTRSLRVTEPDCPIGKVTKDMTTHRFRRLPVVSDGVLFGIVTATDIMKYLGTGKVFDQLVTGDVAEVMGLPVRNLVSGKLFTISPEKSIHDAARMLLDKGVGALPVIESDRLIGLVTEFDLVRVLSGE